jgi:hypothetical protein
MRRLLVAGLALEVLLVLAEPAQAAAKKYPVLCFKESGTCGLSLGPGFQIACSQTESHRFTHRFRVPRSAHRIRASVDGSCTGAGLCSLSWERRTRRSVRVVLEVTGPIEATMNSVTLRFRR